MSGTGDHVILMGAASKGIIQRDFQHHATVYKQPFAKNPFDAVTNEELEAYKQSIENKNRGKGLRQAVTLSHFLCVPSFF